MCKNTEREIMKFILFVLLGFTLSQVAFSASIPQEEEEEDWTDADFGTDDEDEEQEIDGNVEQANNTKGAEDLKSSEKDGRKSDSSSVSDPSASTNDLNPKSAIQTDNLKPNSNHQAEIEGNEDSELEGSDVEEEEEEEEEEEKEEEKEKEKDRNIQVDNENSDYKDEKDNKEKPKLVVNSFENTGEKSQNIDPSKSSIKGNLKNVNGEENGGDEKKKEKVEKLHTDTEKTDHNDAKDDKENPKLAVDPPENTEKESQHADPPKSSIDENPENVNVEDELGDDDDDDEEENEGEREKNGKNEKEERERPDEQKKETEKDQIKESANESSKSAMENSSSNEDPKTINEDVNEENKRESSKDQDEEVDEDDIDQEDDEDEVEDEEDVNSIPQENGESKKKAVQESNESSNLKKEELNSGTDTISQLPSNPKTDSATPFHTNLKEETEENKDEKYDNEDPKSDKKTAISDKEISETKKIDTQSILTTSKSENSTPSTYDHVTDDVTNNSQDSKDKLTADEDKTPGDKERGEGLAEEDENDDEDLEKAEEVPQIKLSKMKKGNKTKLNKSSRQRGGKKENAKNRDTTIEPLQQDFPNSLSNKDDVNNKTIPKDFETIELISSTKQFLIQKVPKPKQKNVFPQKPTKFSSRPPPTSKVSNDKQSFVLSECMNKTPEKFSPPPSRFGSFKGSSQLSSSSSFNSSKKTKADVVDKFYESLDEMTDLYHQVSTFPTKAQSRSAVQQIFGPTGKIPAVDLQPKNLRTPSKNFKSNNSFSLMSSNFENLFTQKSSSPFMQMNGSMWF